MFKVVRIADAVALHLDLVRWAGTAFLLQISVDASTLGFTGWLYVLPRYAFLAIMMRS